MFCPECGAEYREGFSQCRDCQVELEHSLPPDSEDHSPPREFEGIRFDFQPAQAAILKSVLESEGIPHLIEGEGFASLYPALPFFSQCKLMVPEEHAERVKELLADLEESLRRTDKAPPTQDD